VTVGDQVRFIEGPDGQGQIVEVLPRRNQLSRLSPGSTASARPLEQVIVVNVDQVVPVFALSQPEPKWNLLDRYLVSAEAAGLPALICLTKLDLALDASGNLEPELEAVVQEYLRIGYPVVMASAYTGQGLVEVKAVLQGCTSVLVGKSGVGKTSLLNALQPGLGLRVNAVSQATGKGKHTTTHLEMFPLEAGGAIVDTPGVREFGLWDVSEGDLAGYFPEMRPYLGHCRFRLDCRHTDEPGCALRRAVMAGEISPRRYYSYLRLRVEAE
jgi:ribosome biogenesis GTPase